MEGENLWGSRIAAYTRHDETKKDAPCEASFFFVCVKLKLVVKRESLESNNFNILVN